MIIGFAIAAILILLILWMVNTKRRLSGMEENVKRAMSQIGLQLSSRFDALIALLEHMKERGMQEAQSMLNTVKARKKAILPDSTPEDADRQEELLSEVLEQVYSNAATDPALQNDAAYIKCMSSQDSFQKMANTSRLIYNDCVARLNRELKLFPTSLLGSLFGLREKSYYVSDMTANG